MSAQRPSLAFAVEALERRTHLSATLQNGTLNVTGTAGNDKVVVYPDPVDAGGIYVVESRLRMTETTTAPILRSKLVSHFELAGVQQLLINTRRGYDTVVILPLPKELPAMINTGADDDYVSGGCGLMRVYLGDGNDALTRGWEGDRGRMFAFGQGGNDTLLGTGSRDVLDGGDGIDQINGNGGDDIIRGGAGDDVLAGEDGVWKHRGNDSIDGGDGNDRIWGRFGDDTILAGAGIDTLLGGAGNDLLDGGDDEDELDGGDGVDTLIGGTGNDDAIGTDAGQAIADATQEDAGPNSIADASYPQ